MPMSVIGVASPQTDPHRIIDACKMCFPYAAWHPGVTPEPDLHAEKCQHSPRPPSPCPHLWALPPAHPSTPGTHAVSPQRPTPRTYSWSASSSPQIPSPSSHGHIALLSITLESGWRSQPPTVSPPPQKMSPGSLTLGEPGVPAATYLVDLHSYKPKGPTRLPWTVGVGERPRSLRSCSDSCGGICNPLPSCCRPCTEIASSAKYRRVVGHATKSLWSSGGAIKGLISRSSNTGSHI